MEPHGTTRLVALFDDRDAAEQASERIKALFTDVSEVRVADPEDDRLALVGEMQREADRAVPLPASAVATDRQVKGSTFAALVTAPVGAVIGACIGFIPFGDLTLAARVPIGAAIGLLFGLVVGIVAGAGMGADGPAAASAPERSTTLGMTGTAPGLPEALKASGASRVEVLRPDHHDVEHVIDLTEAEREPEAEVLGRHLAQPTGGTWAADQDEVQAPPREP